MVLSIWFFVADWLTSGGLISQFCWSSLLESINQLVNPSTDGFLSDQL